MAVSILVGARRLQYNGNKRQTQNSGSGSRTSENR